MAPRQDGVVDLAGDVSLYATHDFGFGPAFADAAAEVVESGLVAAHPYDADDVQGAVGISVFAAVESVAHGVAAGGFQWCDTAEFGGVGRTAEQAGYDLARLWVNGLITRVPGCNLYRLTGDGLRFAIFYTKLHDRLLRPLLAADQAPAPPPLQKALRTIDIHITETVDQARFLPNAA